MVVTISCHFWKILSFLIGTEVYNNVSFEDGGGVSWINHSNTTVHFPSPLSDCLLPPFCSHHTILQRQLPTKYHPSVCIFWGHWLFPYSFLYIPYMRLSCVCLSLTNFTQHGSLRSIYIAANSMTSSFYLCQSNISLCRCTIVPLSSYLTWTLGLFPGFGYCS